MRIIKLIRERQIEKYFGLIGAIMLCLTAAIISIANWQGLHLTLSQHIALSQITTVLFAVLGGIGAALVAHSLLFYLPKKWDFGIFYKILAAVISFCLIVVCLFPHTTGAVAMIHHICAWTMMFAFIPFLFVLAAKVWQRASVLTRGVIIATALAIIASVSFVIIYYTTRAINNYIFIFESISIAPFLALVVCLALSKKREERK
jgi:hypothetical protein